MLSWDSKPNVLKDPAQCGFNSGVAPLHLRLAPARSFVYKGAINLLPTVLKGGTVLSLSVPLRYLPRSGTGSPPSRCTHTAAAQVQTKSHTWKLWSSAPKAVCKVKTGSLHFSHSPVHDLERFYSCSNVIPHFHSLSFSPFCLSVEGVPPLQFLCCFISPNLHTHTSVLPSYGNFSVTLQTDFLGVPSVRTSSVPLLLRHFNSSQCHRLIINIWWFTLYSTNYRHVVMCNNYNSKPGCQWIYELFMGSGNQIFFCE